MPNNKPLRPQRRRRRPGVLPEIVSPCISVCAMDPQSRVCSGCYRTLQEIATWSGMSNEERWDVLQALRARRANKDTPDTHASTDE